MEERFSPSCDLADPSLFQLVYRLHQLPALLKTRVGEGWQVFLGEGMELAGGGNSWGWKGFEAEGSQLLQEGVVEALKGLSH